MHDPKHVKRVGFTKSWQLAKQIIALVTLHAYFVEMFFMSKELQSQSINGTYVQYRDGARMIW